MSVEGAAPLSTEAQVGHNKHWFRTEPLSFLHYLKATVGSAT